MELHCECGSGACLERCGADNQHERDFLYLLRTLTAELEELEKKTGTHLLITESQIRVNYSDHCSNVRKCVNILRSQVDILEENIASMIGPLTQNAKNQMLQLESATQKYREDTCKLESRCRDQEQTIRNLKDRVEQLESTLCISDDSSTCATKLCSTLSGYLWKLSQDTKIVETLISSGTITTKLFDIVSDSLKSFFVVSNNVELVTRKDEVRCLISLIGLVMNVVAAGEGRKFVVETPEGQEMIRCIIQCVAKFPDIWVQRLMLMVIFNVSINENGTNLVVNEHCLLEVLKKNLKGATEVIRYVTLKLLQVIACNTNNWKHLKVLTDEIPLSILFEIDKVSASDDERKLIREICQRYAEITSGVTT